MPNWCECKLTIKGKEEEVNAFKKFAKGTEPLYDSKKELGVLDMNRFVPYPEEYKKQDKIANKVINDWKKLTNEQQKNTPYPDIKDGYNSGGHEWCQKNWGTKWNFAEPKIIDETICTKLIYDFQTAWSPPIPIINAMSKKFPNLQFTLQYWEGGAGFKGTYSIKNNAVIISEEKKYIGSRGG